MAAGLKQLSLSFAEFERHPKALGRSNRTGFRQKLSQDRHENGLIERLFAPSVRSIWFIKGLSPVAGRKHERNRVADQGVGDRIGTASMEVDVQNRPINSRAIDFDESESVVDPAHRAYDVCTRLLKKVGNYLCDKIIILNNENPPALKGALGHVAGSCLATAPADGKGSSMWQVTPSEPKSS